MLHGYARPGESDDLERVCAFERIIRLVFMMNDIRFPSNDAPFPSLSGEERIGAPFGTRPVHQAPRACSVRSGHLEMKR